MLLLMPVAETDNQPLWEKIAQLNELLFLRMKINIKRELEKNI